jgi:hypothetical protein
MRIRDGFVLGPRPPFLLCHCYAAKQPWRSPCVIERPSYFLSHCEHPKGAWQSQRNTMRDCFASLAMTLGKTMRDCFVASLFAMTPVYVIASPPKAGVAIPTEPVIARPRSGRGDCFTSFAMTRLLRFARNDAIRDCFVASLLAMTQKGCFARNDGFGGDCHAPFGCSQRLKNPYTGRHDAFPCNCSAGHGRASLLNCDAALCRVMRFGTFGVGFLGSGLS